ncbi:MAG: cobalt ECF transporter T component CbiQ [Moorellaceae bacterium]
MKPGQNMTNVEQYAYGNKLRGVHPAEKAMFSLGSLVLALNSRNLWVSLTILGVITWLLVATAGISLRFYIRLMLLPLSFLVTSALAIVITLARPGAQGMFCSLSLGSLCLGVARQDVGRAVQLGLRVLPGVSCLYFLTLTTPMVEIMSLLRRLRVPSLVLELVGLVYHFIFILWDTAEKIYLSQSSRLGYISWSRSLFSLGQLAANLFLKSFQRSQMLNYALVSRGFSGEFRVLEPEFAISRCHISLIFLWLVFLIWLNHCGDWPISAFA